MERFRKKAIRKLEFVSKNFKNFRKRHHMGSSMQRRLSAYFEVQNVIDLQLFYVKFEQNTESQHQHTVASVDNMRNTSALVAIRTCSEGDDHRSVLKKGNDKNHNH